MARLLLEPVTLVDRLGVERRESIFHLAVQLPEENE